ncbi:hypothetical protein ACHWQZ_G014405 [Mnemiopsis leidyi]
MSIISLNYQPSQSYFYRDTSRDMTSRDMTSRDMTSRDVFVRNISSSDDTELPPIPPPHNRFVQTHDIWRKDDPRHHVTYDTTQLTDSLVCVSMSNEIRRTIANLTQNTKDAPSSNQPVGQQRSAVRLTGTTKLFGRSLLTEGGYKTLSLPVTRQNRYDMEDIKCMTAPEKAELDLRLSPVNFKKRPEGEVIPLQAPEQVMAVKKEHDFRLPYRECLTKSKSPTVHILEVECLTCGQIGSIYRHRADKTKCGRCGKILAERVNNKLEYQFRITKQYSGQEVLERMQKQSGSNRRRLA